MPKYTPHSQPIMGEILYAHALESGRSIAPHLPYLRGLVAELQPQRIAEFGTGQAQSTLALRLGALPFASLNSFDLVRNDTAARRLLEEGQYGRFTLFNPLGTSDVRELAKQVVGNNNGPDFLFIDDDHTHEHVFWELVTFAPEVGKCIAMHDTNSPKWPGVRKALFEVLSTAEGSKWEILFDLRIGHGLAALIRK